MGAARSPVRCAYCGGAGTAGEANCGSCGARFPGASGGAVSGPVEGRKRKALLSFAVWLFLGLFGGYAYWCGNKVKAYARVAIWLSTIAWVTFGVAADEAGRDNLSNAFGFAFLGTVLLLLLLWVIDLVHLLSRARESG